MSLPNPEQGARSVLQRAVAVLRDGLGAAVAAINERLKEEDAGYTLSAPAEAEIKPHEMPGVWPATYPAVRLQRTAFRPFPHSGSMGLGNATTTLTANCYVQREHGRTSVSDGFDLSSLSSEAWDFSAAVRQVMERDLCSAGTGIYKVDAGDFREIGPLQHGGDNLRYVMIIEASFSVTQLVRDSFGT